MSMGLLVSYRAVTWLIDECQIAFFHELSYAKKSDPTFLSLFSLSFVFPSTLCLVSRIPRIPVLRSPVYLTRLSQHWSTMISTFEPPINDKSWE